MRKRDELWDALVEELGDVSTKTERGARNAAIKELREVGATAADVHARCHAYRRMWPNISLTASALKKHWSVLTPARSQASDYRSIEEVLDLPDLSEEERLQNLARIRDMAHSIGKPT